LEEEPKSLPNFKMTAFDPSGTPRVRDARYLGMLPPFSIVDRRNPDAAIYLQHQRRQFTGNPVQGRSALHRMDLQRLHKCPGLPRLLTTKQIFG
jgi:hypothetical protein